MVLDFLLTPILVVASYWLLRRSPAGRSAEHRVRTAEVPLPSPQQLTVRRMSQALGIAGAIQLVLMLFRHSTWTLDGDVLLFLASGLGVGLAGVLWTLARPASSGRALARWGALALFGAVSCSAAFLRDVNQDFDFAVPIAREALIVNKSTSATLRGGTTYYLRLDDWTGEGQAREIDLSRRQHQGYFIGQTAAFEEHRGLFGIRWIGNLRHATRPE